MRVRITDDDRVSRQLLERAITKLGYELRAHCPACRKAEARQA